VELGEERIEDLLRRLGFGVGGGGPWQVTVPLTGPTSTAPPTWWRDARLHGYDEFPSRLPKGVGRGCLLGAPAPPGAPALVGAGCYEVLSLSFQARDEVAALGLPDGDPRLAMVQAAQPADEEQAYLRSSLIPACCSRSG